VVVSPELVLVSSPEDAAVARAMLPDFVFAVRRPEPAPSRSAVALFALFCATATVGPLLLAVVTR
jgi:hypothetical protein